MLIASTDFNPTKRRRNAIRCVVVFAGIALQANVAALGAPKSPQRSDRKQPQSAVNAQEPDSSDPDAGQRRQKLKAALYIVGGIAFVGVVAILGIVLWGIRVRRRARTRTKPNSPLDPLWYLRKGSKAASDPDASQQTETHSDSDPEDGADSS